MGLVGPDLHLGRRRVVHVLEPGRFPPREGDDPLFMCSAPDTFREAADPHGIALTRGLVRFW